MRLEIQWKGGNFNSTELLLMTDFFARRTLTIYWIVAVIHCLFQYLQLPFVAVTKPMLIPLLFVYILVQDTDISKPTGKFIYYIGLILAFFGDVLLIIINDTFFLSGMIAYMLANLLFSISFLYLNRINLRSILPVGLTIGFLVFIGNAFYRFLQDDMGVYTYPILVYMVIISIMISCAVNAAGNYRFRRPVITYIVPGVIVFLFENILVALNKFHYERDKNIFVLVMFTYCLAQYLILKGMSVIYHTDKKHPIHT